jgi:phenylacetate-CoA ligase
MIESAQNDAPLPRFPADRFRGLQYAGIEEIEAVQNRLMTEHISYAASKSPHYSELFRSLKISPRDIRTPADLKALPFTEKKDLADHSRFQAVSQAEIVDICFTSGSTGEPVPFVQTASDLSRLAYNEAVAFAMAGLDSNDILIICTALGSAFMAGLAYFLGGIGLKATVIRGGSQSGAQNWRLIKATKATAIVGVPGMMRRIGTHAESTGESPARSTVQRLIAIGNPVRDRSLNPLPLTSALESMWNASLYSTYASTEMASAFCECEARAGGHVRPELIVVEIVNEGGEWVSVGEAGEVVATPLGITGMPLIRFKTGDIAFLIDAPCPCGRKTPRLGPVLGRKNQMLKYKGTTIFPNGILAALTGKPYFEGGYIEVRTGPDGSDLVTLYAAIGAQHAEDVKQTLKAHLRVVPEVAVITRETLEKKIHGEDKRKPVTFFDLRSGISR